MAEGTVDDSPARRTVAEEVYRSLKRDIITLRHRPGSPVTEHELSRIYGGSRAPVREACRRLQQEGLLRSIPYKGYFVGQISVQEIRDSFDLRELLETSALERALQRARPEDLQSLEALAAAEYRFDDHASYGEFLDRNLDFHIRVASLAGNRRLVAVLHDLLSAMQRFFYLGLDLGDFGAEMRNEHEQLVRLIKTGRNREAVDCLRTQVESSRDRILRALFSDRLGIPFE